MEHREGFFSGTGKGRVYYQGWLPAEKPRASLIVVHGLAEHGGRYMNLVNRFVPSGYAVYAIDQPGHGKSDGPRTFIRQFQDYTATLRAFTAMVSEWQAKRPLFLVGHSMGGLIGALYLIEDARPLTGAVISGPLVRTYETVSPALVAMIKALSALIPRFRLVALDATYVSRDPAVVRAYVEDPLVYRGKTTARLAAEIARTMERVTAEARRITLPILIVQAGADRLVHPDGARALHETAGSRDKTIRVYDGLYHEVFNEPEHRVVLEDVKSWIEARLETPKAASKGQLTASSDA